MKVKSIISKPRSKKKYMFYCLECGNKKELYDGIHWCTCADPNYRMTSQSPQEWEVIGKNIDNWFKSMGVKVHR